MVLSLIALRSDAAFGDVYEPADELEVEADFEDFVAERAAWTVQLHGRKRRSDPGMLHRAHTIASPISSLVMVVLTPQSDLCSPASTMLSIIISCESSVVPTTKAEDLGTSRPPHPPLLCIGASMSPFIGLMVHRLLQILLDTSPHVWAER